MKNKAFAGVGKPIKKLLFSSERLNLASLIEDETKISIDEYFKNRLKLLILLPLTILICDQIGAFIKDFELRSRPFVEPDLVKLLVEKRGGYRSNLQGGKGAVREIIEYLLDLKQFN